MTITFPRGRKKSGEEKYRRNIFIVYNICSCVASAKIMKNAEGLNIYESLHKTLERTSVVTMLALN